MEKLLGLGLLSTLLVPSLLVCLNPCVPHIDHPLSFKLLGATNLSYLKFLEDLRGILLGSPPEKKVEGLPVLRPRRAVKPNERILSVHLCNLKDEEVILGIDVVDAYVVGYVKAETFYYFSDCSDRLEFIRRRFPETQHKQLEFCSNYSSLQDKVSLGSWGLDHAISSLLHDDPKDYQLVGKALICIIQMISEAARFREIGKEIGKAIETGQSCKPSLRWLRLYNLWSKLSKAMEIADKNGDINFKKPFEIFDVNDKSKISIPDLPTAKEKIEFGFLLHKLEAISDNGDILIDIENESDNGNGNGGKGKKGNSKGGNGKRKSNANGKFKDKGKEKEENNGTVQETNGAIPIDIDNGNDNGNGNSERKGKGNGYKGKGSGKGKGNGKGNSNANGKVKDKGKEKKKNNDTVQETSVGCSSLRSKLQALTCGLSPKRNRERIEDN